MSAPDTLRVALDYHDRGLALLPLWPAGRDKDPKEPHFDALDRVYGTVEWQLLAERRASKPEVRAWFEHDPNANIGIVLGQPSGGLVCADVDEPSAARDLRHPPTWIAQASRGPHIFFRTNGKTSTRETPWGELRGDGSYVVAAPSIHESGHQYFWSVSPGTVQLADLALLRTANGERLTSNVERLSIDGVHLGTKEEVPLPRYPAFPDVQEVARLPSKGKGLARLETAVVAAMRSMGVEIELGSTTSRKFSCVLPGHGPDRHPSAALHRGPDGTWRYLDFHRPGDPSSLTLAEVRASRSARRIVQLPGPSQARWYRRLFFEAGMLRVEPVMLRLPDGLSANATRAAQGFELLLTIRQLDHESGPAPFSRDFAAAWCGMGERQAGDAIVELREAGVLTVGGRHGRTNLYLPGLAARGPRSRMSRSLLKFGDGRL